MIISNVILQITTSSIAVIKVNKAVYLRFQLPWVKLYIINLMAKTAEMTKYSFSFATTTAE